MSEYEKIKKSSDFILEKVDEFPTIGLVLGSGLGAIADTLEDAVSINYSDIPGFYNSIVVGHKNRLVIGKLDGVAVVCMQGRFHYYEGHSQKDIAFPIRVLAMCGVKQLILTNAAGGLNIESEPASLMCIEDHINLSGSNPLIGPNIEEIGPRFPDMTRAYSKRLIDLMKQTAIELGIDLKTGVYMYFSGPSYETPAEIRMAKILGADAVGMSTVPEVIAARHAGIETCGISCITNYAAGILDKELNHEEVIESSKKANENFKALIINLVKKFQEADDGIQ